MCGLRYLFCWWRFGAHCALRAALCDHARCQPPGDVIFCYFYLFTTTPLNADWYHILATLKHMLILLQNFSHAENLAENIQFT